MTKQKRTYKWLLIGGFGILLMGAVIATFLGEIYIWFIQPTGPFESYTPPPCP